MGAEQSDGQLLHAFVRERSEAAFEEVVRRHERLVFATCRRVLGRSHDAEDASQAAFLTLARKASTLTGSQTVAPWLHRVAFCVATDLKRRRVAEPVGDAMAQRAEQSQNAPDHDAMAGLAMQELAQLPEKYRAPLVLFHLEGRSLEETAAALGRPVGTISTWLNRGRELLRERLARRGAILTVALLSGLLSAEAGAAECPAQFSTQMAQLARRYVDNLAGGSAVADPSSGALTQPSTTAIALSEGALKTMAMQRLSHAAAVIAACLLGGTLTLVMAADKPETPANHPPVPQHTPDGGTPAAETGREQRAVPRRPEAEPAGRQARPGLATPAQIRGWAAFEAKKVSFEFADTPLRDAVAFLSAMVKETGVTMAVGQDIGETPVTMTMKDINITTALDTICKLSGAKMEIKDKETDQPKINIKK